MRTRFKKTATAILTLSLMLATCEVATRLFARVPKNVFVRDVDVGRRFIPGIDEYIYNAEAGAPIYFQTNELGFRGEPVTMPKPDYITRIAVVGDSYTAAQALPEESTFCGVLEQRLNAMQVEGRQWEVLNFGVPGAGTGQELALYRHIVSKVDPDIVLVAFGNATDLRDNSQELGSNPIVYFETNAEGELVRIPISSKRTGLSNWLNANSHFYYWQKERMGLFKDQFRHRVAGNCGRHLIYAKDEPQSYSRAWDLTSAILKTFDRECRNNGTDLIVAGLPSAYQIYPDQLTELMAERNTHTLDATHPDRRLETICVDLQIPFMTLTDTFIDHTPGRSYQIEDEQLFFDGRTHFNARGSHLAGAELAAWISGEVRNIAETKTQTVIQQVSHTVVQ